MEELRLVAEFLAKLDEDGAHSMGFYYSPPEMKVPPIINQIQKQTEFYYYSKYPEKYHKDSGADSIINSRVEEILKYVGANHHAKSWPCHSEHFHPTFLHYVACPFTTLTELVEFFKKL